MMLSTMQPYCGKKMTKKIKPCPQCHSVGFHKMSCTEPYKARKPSQATTIAHTPSNPPQRASLWLTEAFKEQPEGIKRGWCGGLNDFADDCGWYAITPTGNDTRICCRECYKGPLGKAHIERYGLGER